MIKAIRSNNPSFKSVTFTEGFNVVLAERTNEATDKDSRNGLGKTTLIEIIHFCLGADIRRGKGLGGKYLLGWTFTLDLLLNGKAVSASRNTEDSSRIFLNGDFSSWPIKPERDSKTNTETLSVKDWTRLLGILMFGLDDAKQEAKYQPKFRSLISYFIRRSRDGAFVDPFSYFKSQREWNKQLNNAFLLGLNWRYASEWQELKDKEKTLKELKKAATDGLLDEVFGGTIGELEAKRVQQSNAVSELTGNLKVFKVHQEYHRIEQEVNALTKEIQNLSNQNITDKNLLEKYRANLHEEKEPAPDLIKKIYEEVGVTFPQNTQQRFSDVIEFHHKVIVNRKEYLKAEIDRLTIQVSVREKKVLDLSDKKTEAMGILSAHGALDEYTRLQMRLVEKANVLKDTEGRIKNLKSVEEGRSNIKIEREQLLRKARTDLEERKAVIEQAITLFHENSQALYQSAGTLLIDVNENGYKFNVEIERSQSQGVNSMKIFCYDLMLVQRWTLKRPSPEFLIHDSTLFDGVDERQRAKAIELAASEATQKGFQYICALNSDMIPTNDFSAEFNFQKFVRIKFTDATDDGGLLGIRF